MNMNSREKVLIIILAAIVILLGGFKLLIEPAQKDLAAKKIEYQIAQDNKLTADLNVLRAKGIDKENADLEKKIADTSAPFFPDIKNDKLQLFFNNILVKDNIAYNSFVMTPPVVSQILNPPGYTDKLVYPAKDAALVIEEINKEKPFAAPTPVPADNAVSPVTAGGAANDLVELSTVTMQFAGSLAQTNLLLDDIKNSGRVARVSSLNIFTGDKGAVTITVTTQCYGVKKYDNKDVLLKDTLVK